MKYFPSQYLDALSKFDDRLVSCFETSSQLQSDETLLIEEKDCSTLFAQCAANPHLIVLTERKSLSLTNNRIKKSVFKYQKVRHLLSQIFEERHEIRLFFAPLPLASQIQSLLSEKIINAPFIDYIDEFTYSDALLNGKLYEQGVHYIFASILDVLDPPVDLIKQSIQRQSEMDSVDIILHSLSGPLSKELMELSDIIYFISDNEHPISTNTLKNRYSNTVFLHVDSHRQSPDTSRILPARGEYELSANMQFEI